MVGARETRIWLLPLSTDRSAVRSQRHTRRRNQIQKAFFKSHSGDGLMTFNFCTKLYLRNFTEARKKKNNWQHCYQGCGINSNIHQIAVFLSPSDSFWPMKRGCCHLCHFWVEAWKPHATLVSLFPAPEAACSTWYTCKLVEPRWPQYVCRLVMNVCMHVCVPSEIWESVVPASEQSLFWRRERKTKSVTWSRYFSGSPLPSVSSSQAAPSGLNLIPLWGLVDS